MITTKQKILQRIVIQAKMMPGSKRARKKRPDDAQPDVQGWGELS